MTDTTQTPDLESAPESSHAGGAIDHGQGLIVVGAHAERVAPIADDVEALVPLDPAAAADGAVTVVDALARLLEEEDH